MSDPIADDQPYPQPQVLATLAVPCVLGQPAAITVTLSEPAATDIVIIPSSSDPQDTFSL